MPARLEGRAGRERFRAACDLVGGWERHGFFDDLAARRKQVVEGVEVAVYGADPDSRSTRDLVPAGRLNPELAVGVDSCGDDAPPRPPDGSGSFDHLVISRRHSVD